MVEALERDRPVGAVAQYGGIDRMPQDAEIKSSVAQYGTDRAALESGKRPPVR